MAGMSRLLAIAGLAVSALLPCEAQAAKRVALLVGNNAYAEVPALSTAVNDVQASKATLERLGFAVELVENGTKRQISRAIAKVEGMIAPGDAVVFHFAGHGFEIDGQNWLLPVDVPAARQGEAGLVKDESFNASDVIERLRARGAATVLAILDACRDNPFAKTGTRSLGGTRGLAQMEASGGVFIIFSAAAKQQALDRLSESDPVRTSIFARSFLPLLSDPNLTLIDLAKEAQLRVRDLARTVGHDQVPAYYDNVVGRITVTGEIATAGARPAQEPRPEPPVSVAAVAAPPVQPGPTRDVSSPDIEACDRVAAHPLDPDKPAHLAGVAFDGIGAPAVVACRKAAERPDAPRRIFYQLGRVYEKLGNAKDAATVYAKAADLKHPGAMSNLGMLSKSGKGVPRDYGFARTMFERAAEAGEVGALFEVGEMYHKGLGSPVNYGLAKLYYEKSAALGDGRSHNNLGQLHFYGLGMRTDRNEACRLFDAGAKAGNAMAESNRRRLCRQR